ncbi:MAG: hypothetical protein AAF725_13810 [Acidobacteriota bacterium]
MRWGDYSGATVGPDGDSLWYASTWTLPPFGADSNWVTGFLGYTFPDRDSDGIPNSCDVCGFGDDDQDADGDTVPDSCDFCPGSDDRFDADQGGIPDGCDTCLGDDLRGDDDGDGAGRRGLRPAL